MRNFFINALDLLIGLIAIILILLVLYVTYLTATADVGAAAFTWNGISLGSGPAAAGIMFVAGTLYTIVVVGFLYIGTGIYKNTKRTADAVEEMLRR